MPNKNTDEKLDIIVTFRLSETEFKPYKSLIDKSGLSKSKVMREIFISKSDKAVLPKTPSADSKRLLFLANKASNNLNQIAHKFNLAHNKGTVNEKAYLSLLNSIINIERTFLEASKKC